MHSGAVAAGCCISAVLYSTSVHQTHLHYTGLTDRLQYCNHSCCDTQKHGSARAQGPRLSSSCAPGKDVASESGHAPGRVLAPEDGARLLPVRGGHAAARAGRASRLPQPAWPRRRVPARGPETAHQLAGRGRPVRRAAPLRCARCACPPRTCALARAMRRKHLPSDTRAHTDARQSAAGERKSSSGASMAGILKVRAPAAASALTFLSGLPACPC